ncbi:alpha/beta hydrolase [Pelagibacterium montanilacus]|uniref:alpha/beta hydrolase n=1 Tax=Pelagibacterium montanilacus TaxID=2185280 RepID=UPI000F8F6FB9|nr:alpha/beta hydrolase [Pelagibacterium montanilacus]
MTKPLYAFREHKAKAEDATTLVVLHGTGGDENQFFDLGRQLLPQARIVSPRGDVSENGALRFFRRAAEGVYDMEDLAKRTETMAAFVKGLGATGKVIGLGYSNGANILASVLLAHPGLFNAAVLMHPLIPWDPEDVPGLAGTDILVTAGRNDPLTTEASTQNLIDYFARQGAAVESVWHEGGHEARQEELAGAREFLGRIG